VTRTADLALANFLTYLPRDVEEWLLFYDSRFTKETARRIGEVIQTREVVDLRGTSADEINLLEEKCFREKQVGALFFSLFQAGEKHSDEYLATFERLNVFDTWPSTRCRIVDEVTDQTFDALFESCPASLADECWQKLDQCRLAERALFRGTSESLDIRYDPRSGVAYTGFESYEFNIPSGEVAFQPVAINGTVAFSGWIIGSIPFGQKYGRVTSDQLIITFEGRRITRLSGSAARLIRDLEASFAVSPGLREVNEFGIGLNRSASAVALKHKIGLQWMEKCRGLHLGLGAELTEHISDHRLRRTHHHLDLVFGHGELFVDNELILSWC
jgi:hypothetical protein